MLRNEHPSKHFDYPFKHFVFGIFVRTIDALTKVWRYHVAPIIKIEDGELYILDPVVHDEPMKKDAYHAELESDANKGVDPETGQEETSKLNGFATCKPYTYEETDDCFNSKPDDLQTERVETQTKLYLD